MCNRNDYSIAPDGLSDEDLCRLAGEGAPSAVDPLAPRYTRLARQIAVA